MKKTTVLLLGLLFLQPLYVLLFQSALVTAVPVHFSWTIDIWHQGAGNLRIALVESILAPALILIFRRLPTDTFIPATVSWIFSPKTTWLWWLFGMNWFILLSLFSVASWITLGWQVWTLVCGGQLGAYIINQLWLNQRTKKRHG